MPSTALVTAYQPQSGPQKLAGVSFSVAVVAAAGLLLWGIKPHIEAKIQDHMIYDVYVDEPKPTPIEKPIEKPVEVDVPIFVPQVETIVERNDKTDPPIHFANPTHEKPIGPPPPPQTVNMAEVITAKPAQTIKPVGAGECANFASVGETARDDWEKLAEREQLEAGSVSVLFTIAADGSVKDIRPEKSTHAGLTRLAVKAVSHLRCNAQGQDVSKRFAVSFRMD